MGRMRIGTRVFAAILALIGMLIVVPASADAHAMLASPGIAGHSEIASPIAAMAADCAGGPASLEHGACCGASNFGCCPPCLLVPPESAASLQSGAPVFAENLVETAAGLPPSRLKRPPRLAR